MIISVGVLGAAFAFEASNIGAVAAELIRALKHSNFNKCFLLNMSCLAGYVFIHKDYCN